MLYEIFCAIFFLNVVQNILRHFPIECCTKYFVPVNSAYRVSWVTKEARVICFSSKVSFPVSRCSLTLSVIKQV
jgi:hypothetical protein